MNGVTIPAAAQSLVGNVTVLSPSTGGYITLWPANAARPLVASGNYNGSDTINSPFTVGLTPETGEFKIFTIASTHLTVDVLGYYSTESEDVNGKGLLFNPLAHPVRLLETRPNLPVGCYKPSAPITGQLEYTQPARGTCDGLTIPTNAEAVVGNATVVNDPSGGQLKLWKSDITQPLPTVANYVPWEILNRHVTVSLGAGDGAFKIFASYTTDLVVDLVGYFAPPDQQSSAYSLTVPAPATVVAETNFTVNWTAPAGHSTSDWIAIYRPGTANSEFLDYKEVPAGASGTVTFTAPYYEGAYQFRYLLSPVPLFLDVATSNNFTVYALDVPAERLDPLNRVGTAEEDLLSGNYNWGTTLVSLPGRAGLDLNLSLNYNSLVWTKSSTQSLIGFDKDFGFPSPGFRLGLPVLQGSYVRPIEGVYVAYFILVLPSGRRVELRFDQASGTFLSTDSSYLRLKSNPGDNGNSVMLYYPDGSRYAFYRPGTDFRCEKVIDRNGNYLNITYLSNSSFISYIQDTLGRKIDFVYDSKLLGKNVLV